VRAPEHRVRPAAFVVLAVLAAMVAAIYGQTLSFDYVFDDQGYILGPAEMREGLSPAAVLWALRSWDYGNWFPLTRLSWLADVELFGMNPGPAHLVNALVHLANAWCMFLVLTALTGLRWRSAALAALWAAHPLQVEAVAWITERSLLLATLFLWAALGAYLGYVRRPGAGRYLAVVLAALLGYLCKPILLALPLLLLLLDWWPLGRMRSGAHAPGARRQLIVEKLPLAVLAAGFGMKAIIAQSAVGSLASMDALSFVHRAGNAVRGVSWYIVKAVLPTGLGPYYPLSPDTVRWWHTAAAAALLTVITLAVARAWRTRPAALAGWLWFALTLLPVSGLVQTGSHASADRFSYIPLIGLLFMVGGLPADRGDGKRRAPLAVATAALGVVVLAAASFAQTRYWRDELSLFGRALAVADSESTIIRNHLAEACEKAGDFASALRHNQVALKLRPDWAPTRRGLGRLMIRRGDLEDAERHLREAVKLEPKDQAVRDDLDDFLRCRQDPGTAAACLDRSIIARWDGRGR